VVGTIVALGDDDDADERVGPATTTTTTAPVSDTGQELLDRLAVGHDLTLHLRFESEDATAEDGPVTVELWRDGDRVRQDLILTVPGARTELSAFQLPTGNVLCQRASEAEWTCERTVSLATEAGEPAGLVEAAAADLAGADVVATDEVINGEDARCYAIEGSSGASTLCVTDEGIPVRLAVQGSELTASVIERSVDGDVFEVPAEVQEPASTTTTA
jgi:hypothetical protein